MKSIKRRDGFEGEKMINLPESVLKKVIRENVMLDQLYITHIGYFPNASYHYREWQKGCPDNILIYCLRGKGWYELGKRRFEVGVNEYIIIPATKDYLRYGADEKDPWTIYWVHFSGRDMDTFNRSFEIGRFDGPQPIIYNEKGLEIWHMMYHNLEIGYSKENLTNTNMFLYSFIATFLYPDRQMNEKKQDAKDLITDTILYMQRELHRQLTVDAMAQNKGLSTSHFSSLFRKATGMSPLDYFIHLKLQKACLLLYSSDTKVKEVAKVIGYEDPYYFSRLFKKYMKVSPDQYRALQKKG